MKLNHKWLTLALSGVLTLSAGRMRRNSESRRVRQQFWHRGGSEHAGACQF